MRSTEHTIETVATPQQIRGDFPETLAALVARAER
jgi:hypothetical protein